MGSHPLQVNMSGVVCDICDRIFDNHWNPVVNENSLRQHMQVHKPRNVRCPLCREVRFKSGANVVQHIEEGYCSSCRGKDNARRQIQRFMKSNPAARQFIRNAPALTYNVVTLNLIRMKNLSTSADTVTGASAKLGVSFNIRRQNMDQTQEGLYVDGDFNNFLN